MRDENLEQYRIADARVRVAVRAAGIKGVPLRDRIQRWIAPRNRRTLLLAAGSLAIAALAAGIVSHIAPRVPRLYWEAAADHHREVADSRGNTLASEPIASLAKGHGVAASVLQALGRDGYQPKKGDVRRLDGRLFLHLLYSDGTRTFSAYLRPRDRALASAPAEAHLGGEHLVFVQGVRLTLLLVASNAGEAVARAHSAAALL